MLGRFCLAQDLQFQSVVQISLCNAVFSLGISYNYLENWPSELSSLKYAAANELLHGLWRNG